MPPLPVISGKDLLRILTRQGFVVLRQRGSHVRIRHPDGRVTTIPVHTGATLPRGLLHKILYHDLELSTADISTWFGV